MRRNAIAALLLVGIWQSAVAPAADFESDYISIKTEGKGRDIILIPGFACSPEVWSGLSKEIGSGFRLHFVSVAGFAGAAAPKEKPEKHLMTLRDEITRYLEKEKIEKPVFIGHSMGGLTSLLVASKSPEKVGAVVVVDSLPFFSLIFNPEATVALVSPQAIALEKQTLSLDDAGFEQQAKFSAAILTKTEEKRDLLVQWSKESDRAVYARYFREIMLYDARPELGKVTCPVTVLYPYDEAMGVAEAELGKRYTDAYSDLKGVHIRQIPDSFHFIMWDQPERFSEAVKKALASAP